MNGEPVTILFLCTGNSCRSQMAEGWARELLGGQVEPYSAGVTPKEVDPRAVQVMAAGAVGEEEILAPYRQIRDEIRAWVEGIPDNLKD